MSGNDTESGADWRQSEWLQTQIDGIDRVLAAPNKPRPALELACRHWPGTLLGCVVIIWFFALAMGAAVAIGG